ncbi:hypothetical protein E2C01_057299 [Portunus trituberculatus]|uniref:Uncharacterized protein n=1 Tax=Portunus trituberculatus TaxID=210409 RepID=A0A5B7H0N8_PORTR|nr:hypothetical protein [Portunus trituberculatus]
MNHRTIRYARLPCNKRLHCLEVWSGSQENIKITLVARRGDTAAPTGEEKGVVRDALLRILLKGVRPTYSEDRLRQTVAGEPPGWIDRSTMSDGGQRQRPIRGSDTKPSSKFL